MIVRKKVISKHTKSIINQLLKDPILVAKEIAAEEGASEKLALFAKIFDLETEEVESRAEEVEHKECGHHPFHLYNLEG